MNFNEILIWIENFSNGKKFTLQEINSNTDGEFIVKKTEKGLCFHLGFPVHKLFFEENLKFILKNDFITLRINHFILTNSLYDKKFQAYIYESKNFSGSGIFYHRLLSEIKSLFYIDFLKENKREFEILLNNCGFRISQTFYNKNNYLVIESLNKITFEEFKHSSNSILFSIGFIKGQYVREEQLFFQSQSNDWINIIGFYVRTSSKSMLLEKPFTKKPEEYSNFIEDENFSFDSKSTTINEKELEKIISLLNSNERFFTAISILFDSFSNSLITRPSILFVVLETLIEEISKIKEPKKIKAIKIKDGAKQILEKYKSTIEKEDYDNLVNAVNEIDKKLSQNNKKIESVFTLLNIELSTEERKVIGKRNKFFHGEIIDTKMSVKNEEDYMILEKEHLYLSCRLYNMISKLLLKYIGFEGYLLNHAKLRDKYYNKNLDEEYFIRL